METTAKIPRLTTPAFSLTPSVPVPVSQQPQPLEGIDSTGATSLQTTEAADRVGLPDEATQQVYTAVHDRAIARRNKFYGNGSFFKAVDDTKLNDAGREHRKRVAAGTVEPTLVESLLGKLDKAVRFEVRQQILPFPTAQIVVTEIFNRLESKKNKPAYFTDEQLEIVDNVTKYFIADKTGPYPLHKGLFIYGKFGVGKGHIFRAMQMLCKIAEIRDMVFDEIPTKTFVESYKDYKEGKDKKAVNPLTKYSRGNLLLNDWGEEDQQIKSFTNTINPIDLLLSERNIAFDEFGHRTHATSNLGLGKDSDDETALESDLRRLYGDRILDRFYDQFTAVHLPGESKRG